MSKNVGYIFNIQKFCLHDGEGIRTAVFFSGCNLRCKWCANPESILPITDKRSEAKEYTVLEIVKEVLTDKPFYDKSGGGVMLTGGEVFTQKDFAVSLAKELQKNKINVAIETAGCVDEHSFNELISEVDFVFIDCKHYDDKAHQLGTGASNKAIVKNILSLIKSNKPHCVRIPVIPEFNDELEDASKFVQLFNELGVKKVQLLPFHQMAEKKYEDKKLEYAFCGVKQMNKEQLAEYASIFASSGISVQIGG